jgi:hypothetical protein
MNLIFNSTSARRHSSVAITHLQYFTAIFLAFVVDAGLEHSESDAVEENHQHGDSLEPCVGGEMEGFSIRKICWMCWWKVCTSQRKKFAGENLQVASSKVPQTSINIQWIIPSVWLSRQIPSSEAVPSDPNFSGFPDKNLRFSFHS